MLGVVFDDDDDDAETRTGGKKIQQTMAEAKVRLIVRNTVSG